MNITVLKLNEAVKNSGLTATEVARRVGISKPYMCFIQKGWTGKRGLSKWAGRFSEVLGVPVEELFPDLAEPDDHNGNGHPDH